MQFENGGSFGPSYVFRIYPIFNRMAGKYTALVAGHFDIKDGGSLGRYYFFTRCSPGAKLWKGLSLRVSTTHLTEKVWHQICIEEEMLFTTGYYVVPICGTSNEIIKGICPNMVFSMIMRLHWYLPFKFELLQQIIPETTTKWQVDLKFEC